MTTNINSKSDSLLLPRIVNGRGVPKNSMARVLDIFVVFLAAPYIALAILILILLIQVDSRGPVFYAQARVGRNGRKFYLYKLRTMVQNADEVLQKYLDESPELKAEWLAIHKLRKDPRITRVGAILRKFSLDELPQIWNILIGDMSLIGPRPIYGSDIERYGKCFELYIQVRPGLTGLWQVSGRSDTTFERRVELDEYYILNRSFQLDIQILLKTVSVVLGSKGAY
jgi:Undecaprenyl-phosphate galactose phosphotransferase WbaP